MSASFNFKLKFNVKELERLQVNVKSKYQAQVGVMGNTTQRGDQKGVTNAEVLLVHETGSITKNIPRRSVFESLNINQDVIMQDIKKIIANDIRKGNPIYETYFKTALVMLEICKEAFFTNGYGTWEPLKQKTIDNKLSKVKNRGSAQLFTLVDEGFLLNAITFRVKKVK